MFLSRLEERDISSTSCLSTTDLLNSKPIQLLVSPKENSIDLLPNPQHPDTELMTETKIKWRIDDRTLRMSIADGLISYLEETKRNDRPCCDVNLRSAIQLVMDLCDPVQVVKLRSSISPVCSLLARVKRDHRPRVTAALDEFRDFYLQWNQHHEQIEVTS
jgi:hypothetical protein